MNIVLYTNCAGNIIIEFNLITVSNEFIKSSCVSSNSLFT